MSPLIFAVSSDSLTFTAARVADLLTRCVALAALYARPARSSQCDTDLERAKTNTTKYRTKGFFVAAVGSAASPFSLDDGGVSRGLWWRCIWWRRGRGTGVERGAVERWSPPAERFSIFAAPSSVFTSSWHRCGPLARSGSSRSRATDRAYALSASSARVLLRFFRRC